MFRWNGVFNMDLIKINNTTFQPIDMVEGWSSLVWTERYREPGDFELKSYDVAKFWNLLPKRSMVALRDSAEAMIVETRIVETDEDGVDMITITGRTFDAFLSERRITGDRMLYLGGYAGFDENGEPFVSEYEQDTKWEMKREYTAADAAALLIWNTIIDVNPVITGVNEAIFRVGVRYHGNPNDVIDNVLVSKTGSFSDDPVTRWVELGYLSDNVLALLEEEDLGIRCFRPTVPSVGVMTFGPGGAPKRTVRKNVEKLVLDIYKGVNRSVHKHAGMISAKQVVFSFETGDILAPRYIDTDIDRKTIAAVDNDVYGIIEVAAKNKSLSATGLNRRIGYYTTEIGEGKTMGPKYRQRLQNEAKRTANANSGSIEFDGQISPLSEFQYKKHYNLGDLVTVEPKYGPMIDLQVTEYIRTEDENGEQGYPTLSADE